MGALTHDMSCLRTIVKNISGAAKHFPFLPPHGVTLATNEIREFAGDLTQAVRQGDRFGPRHVRDLERSLDDGYLQILSTPAQIMVDSATGASQQLRLDNGILTLEDPCWSSDEFGVSAESEEAA